MSSYWLLLLNHSYAYRTAHKQKSGLSCLTRAWLKEKKKKKRKETRLIILEKCLLDLILNNNYITLYSFNCELNYVLFVGLILVCVNRRTPPVLVSCGVPLLLLLLFWCSTRMDTNIILCACSSVADEVLLSTGEDFCSGKMQYCSMGFLCDRKLAGSRVFRICAGRSDLSVRSCVFAVQNCSTERFSSATAAGPRVCKRTAKLFIIIIIIIIIIFSTNTDYDVIILLLL